MVRRIVTRRPSPIAASQALKVINTSRKCLPIFVTLEVRMAIKRIIMEKVSRYRSTLRKWFFCTNILRIGRATRKEVIVVVSLKLSIWFYGGGNRC